MTDAIQVQNVYKQFDTIGTLRIRTIFQDAMYAIRNTAALRKPTVKPEQRYVLNDVSFNLEHGKSLGLIGHNGSGKTTLLRLLAGVSLPTKGRVAVNGKVTPLLALGAGFHPDLTGRENLYMNYTLMGLNRKQADDRIDQIIAFAEIGNYIETPIKRYSSGMLARLGFAAAVHMDPEIILLDEVLSVGDYVFGIKAAAAIREFTGKGTLLFVSHDLFSVEKLCERVIWIDHGQVKADGPSAEVIAMYTQNQQKQINKLYGDVNNALTDNSAIAVPTHQQVFNPRVRIHSVSVHNTNGEKQTEFTLGEDIVLRCHVQILEPLDDLRVSLGITDTGSRAIITLCDSQLLDPIGSQVGDHILEGVFPSTQFRPRNLGVFINVANPTALKPYAIWHDIGPRFFVVGPRRDAEHHYYAPQLDLVYTPNVQMRRVKE